MFETRVTVQRPEGTILTGSDGRTVQHLAVKIDQMTPGETLQHQDLGTFRGAIGFKIFVDWQPNALLRHEDILIDEEVIDPDTHTYYKYRVSKRVKNFLYDHQELIADTVVGT